MKRLTKKVAALILGAAMAVSVLAGCSQAPKVEDYADTVVATLGDENIYLDEAMMYLRYDQQYYEMMYTYFYGTTDIWNMEVETGITMEDTLKQSEMQMLRQIYVLKSQAEDLGISLSEADLAKVEESVDAMREESGEKLLASIGISRERMIQAYQNNALANLVYQSIIEKADTVVAEEEMRCVGVTYVKAPFETEEEGKALSPEDTIKAIAEAYGKGETLEDAAAVYSLTPTAGSFFVGDTYEEGSLGEAALTMKEGESKILTIEESGVYLMVLNTLRDETATENKKNAVIAERQAELFAKEYEKLQEASPVFQVVEKVWKAVPMTTVFEPETTPETESVKETLEETPAETAEETQEETSVETAEETTQG